MQRITFFFSLIVLLNLPLNAQECNDPLCKTILFLYQQNKKKTKEINQQEINIRFLKNQYAKLAKSRRQEQQKLRTLQKQINLSNEKRIKLESDKISLQQELIAAYENLKRLKKLSTSQKKLLKQYKNEISDLINQDRLTKNSNDILEKGIKQIIFENSYLHNIEVGYKQNGKMHYSKVIKDGEESFTDDRGMWSNRLTHIRISGKAYIPILSPYNRNKVLKGKLLIYANNELRETVELELSDQGNGHYYHFYELENREFLLKNKFPEGADLKVAFMNNQTYTTASQEETNQFWTAQQKGLFTITSLTPSKKDEKITIEKILESAKMSGAPIKTTSPELVIKIFDNGDIDNDRADFYFNDSCIISNYTLTSRVLKQILHLQKGTNKFTVIPLDTGTQPTCTVTLQIFDDEKYLSGITLHAEIGNAHSISIIRE